MTTPVWQPILIAVVGILTAISGIYAARSSKKANSETVTITGFKELVASLENRVDAQGEELEKCNLKIRDQSLRIDKLERREQVMIRWARSVVTWYNVVLPHLDRDGIPPFPPPPPGVETAYGDID